jgi:hypothetical protein
LVLSGLIFMGHLAHLFERSEWSSSPEAHRPTTLLGERSEKGQARTTLGDGILLTVLLLSRYAGHCRDPGSIRSASGACRPRFGPLPAGRVGGGAYRDGRLTMEQVRQVLGFCTRMQVDSFLLKHEIYDYTVEDLDKDMATLDRVLAAKTI